MIRKAGGVRYKSKATQNDHNMGEPVSDIQLYTDKETGIRIADKLVQALVYSCLQYWHLVLAIFYVYCKSFKLCEASTC